MRLHRLIAILLLLESRRKMKARELAEALETTERTIFRDLAVLAESGVPVTAQAGPNGGFSLMEGYSVDMNRLNSDDVVNLYLSGVGLRPSEHTEASISLKKALAALESSLPKGYQSDIQVARERFYYDPAPWFFERPSLPHLDALRTAVWQSRKITIKYSGREPFDRILRPYGLVVKSTTWYLAAYWERWEKVSVFRVDRIKEVALLDETFEIPSDFDLEAYWKQQSQEFIEGLSKG
jgi:predicted DNA-binding transcriptional regulator YafY